MASFLRGAPLNGDAEWDAHLARLRESDDLAPGERRRVVDGVGALQEVFDDAWLERAHRRGHPIVGHLESGAPWERHYLADLGDRLAIATELPNFHQHVRPRLLERHTFAQARAEVEVATDLARRGLAPEFIAPEKRSKTPDIRADVAGREVLFEVTVKGSPEVARRAARTSAGVIAPFSRLQDVGFACVIHKPLSRPRIRELRVRIGHAVDAVRAAARPRALDLSAPGVADCWVFHPDAAHEVPPWLLRDPAPAAGGNGHPSPPRGRLEGPKYTTDEVRRIAGTIGTKRRQLPADRPGVLVIYDHHLGHDKLNGSWPRGVVWELDEFVNEYPHLCGVILKLHTFLPAGASGVEWGDGYVLHTDAGGDQERGRQSLLIRNRYPRYPLSDGEVARVLGVDAPGGA